MMRYPYIYIYIYIGQTGDKKLGDSLNVAPAPLGAMNIHVVIM